MNDNKYYIQSNVYNPSPKKIRVLRIIICVICVIAFLYGILYLILEGPRYEGFTILVVSGATMFINMTLLRDSGTCEYCTVELAFEGDALFVSYLGHGQSATINLESIQSITYDRQEGYVKLVCDYMTGNGKKISSVHNADYVIYMEHEAGNAFLQRLSKETGKMIQYTGIPANSVI